MICDECQGDFDERDFIRNSKICYRCVYLNKTKNNKKKKSGYVCKNCNVKFSNNENIKGKQRTSYCSLECAQEGHKHQINNYWTKSLLKSYKPVA